LSEIFSTQIQLGKVDSQKHLLKQAELRTLQGQVNPHFFFNTINTISAVMRFDPDKARRLLIKLSQYFRANLTGNRQTLVQVTNEDRKSTRLNSSHVSISYAVFCLKKKNKQNTQMD